MADVDALKDCYSEGKYWEVILKSEEINRNEFDEWAYVFLANSYNKVSFLDECVQTINSFRQKYPDSKKLELLSNDLSKRNTVYTVGYSSFTFGLDNANELVREMKKHNIGCLIDVRSVPYSKGFAQFDENRLSKELENSGIHYLSLKKEFGAKRDDDVYSEFPIELVKKFSWGKKFENCKEYVDFEKVYSSDIFLSGVQKVHQLLETMNVCFMCSEKEPWNCHRCIMVSEYFRRNGFFVKHIVNDHLILQEEVNKEIIRFFNESASKMIHKPKQTTLFVEKDNLMDYWKEYFKTLSFEKAIALKNIQIGFKR